MTVWACLVLAVPAAGVAVLLVPQARILKALKPQVAALALALRVRVAALPP